MVRKLQPDAVIFSDVGPDIRWVGNERGFANETCWATYDPVGEDGGPPAPGYTRYKEAGTGHRNGSKWLPAECDVSIRPGWFWHEKENAKVRTPRDLMDLYYKSVGRGASFLLNVPPDRRGLLHENDVASLAGFGKMLRGTFERNLARAGKRDMIDLGHPVTFNVVRLREDIRLGQRVDAFAIDTWQEGAWKTLAEATSIGSCRLIRTPADVTTSRVRLRIVKSAALPAISDFSLFLEAQ
jgi:alpha-L-fucosidase